MSETNAEIYQERGIQLSEARRLMADDAEYRSAVALVSVHSGIAFNDAILATFNLSAVRNEDHQRAAEITKKECSRRGIDANGIEQLRRLLKAKTAISYSPERVSQDTAKALSAAADRFETWFHRTMKEIR